MIYPIATVYGENNLEITASKPEKDGSIIVNIEKWNSAVNDFSNLQIKLPAKQIISNKYFTETEINTILAKIYPLSNEILEYVFDINRGEYNNA